MERTPCSEGSFVFIWNAWEKLNKCMVDDFEYVIEVPPRDTVSKWYYTYRYQGRGFQLDGEYARYRDTGYEEWIFFFSDEVLHTIRFFKLLSKEKMKKKHYILLDEGVALYYEYYTKYPLVKNYLKKCLMGVDTPSKTYIGWFPDIEMVILSHPEKALPRVKQDRIILQESDIWSERDLWHSWMERKQIIPSVLREDTILFIGSYSEKDAEHEKEKNIIHSLQRMNINLKIVIKPHPRAPANYYEGVSGIIDLSNTLLKYIPVELIFDKMKPICVLAINSSSITYLAHKYSNVSFFVLYKIMNYLEFDSFFSELAHENDNLFIVDSITELEDLGNNCYKNIFRPN